MAAPLADRLRPQNLDEIVGQEHILGKGRALRKIIESGNIPNMIFYGPSGVGKTTVASIIAKNTNKYLCKLNGTSASTQDIRDIVAKIGTIEALDGILLYLDEIQYFTKKQQQTLLEFIENGSITLIASTTENPYFYVYSAILSRSTVFEFKPVENKSIEKAVKRAFDFLSDEKGEVITLEEGVIEKLASGSSGDVRKAIGAAELSLIAADMKDEGFYISLDTASSLAQRSAMRYDKDGDEHYDIISAYQKSMRGSDPDAALHYLARLLEAGDLPSACRRLLVCAAEDVGLAWPQIMPIVKSCVDTAMMVGLPEAAIPLGDAVILVATAPKSNSGHDAVFAAIEDVKKGKSGPIPRQLQNMHYDSAEKEIKGQFYKYPHDFPGHYVEQQYLPDSLKDAKYYHYGDNKSEQGFKAYWDKVKNKN